MSVYSAQEIERAIASPAMRDDVANALAGRACSAAAAAIAPSVQALRESALRPGTPILTDKATDLNAVIEEMADWETEQMNIPLQEAARSGNVDLVKSFFRRDPTPWVDSLHHAFLLAVRHGKAEALEYLAKRPEVSDEWVYYAIIDAVLSKKEVRAFQLRSQRGEPPNGTPSIEDPTKMERPIDDKESFKVIEKLLSLKKFPMEYLEAICEFLGIGCRADVTSLLIDRGLISTQLRKDIMCCARNEDDKTSEEYANVLQTCVTYKLPREDKLWALGIAAFFSDASERKHLKEIFHAYLESGTITLQDREAICDESDDSYCDRIEERKSAPIFFELLTVGLSSQDRLWALNFAIDRLEQICATEEWIVGALVSHYQAEDEGQTVHNLGLLDNQIVDLLKTAILSGPKAIRPLLKACTINDLLVHDAIMQLLDSGDYRDDEIDSEGMLYVFLGVEAEKAVALGRSQDEEALDCEREEESDGGS